MNRLAPTKQALLIAAPVNGCSVRATVRMPGMAKNIVVKLLAKVGAAYGKYEDEMFRSLLCQRIQCNEIWLFRYAKEEKVPIEIKRGPLIDFCGQRGQEQIPRANGS
jgi:hypothetical protein